MSGARSTGGREAGTAGGRVHGQMRRCGMRAGARKVVSDSDNRVMSLIIGYRRSRTESEKRDNSVVRHPFPPGGAAQKREVGENNIWATWPLLADIVAKVPNGPALIFLL